MAGRQEGAASLPESSCREAESNPEEHLNERGRLWAGSEAISFGQGGIRAVAEALAMSQKTVIQGRRELEGKSPQESRVRAC